MIPWLHEFIKDTLGFDLRLLRYITSRAGVACIFAFAVSLFVGPRVIRRLIAMKIGQPLRSAEEVHKLAELHGNKAGTPTMGGVMIVLTVLLSVLLFADLSNPMVWVVLFVFVGMGIVGMIDDYWKVVRKDSRGIKASTKMLLQLVVALSAAIFLYLYPATSGYIRELHLPFHKGPVVEDMGWWCLPFFMLVIVGCSNAVNLTDGLDGLAIGCSVTVALAYAAFCYLVGNQQLGEQYLLIPHSPYAGELTIVCLALVGAGLGFLWFNCHPAKVFMGDTGSLALGGAFATLAICSKHEAVLIIVGGVFVMEAASVILQVGSVKLRGKRIFRMSPIHHHFELKGWHESQVIVRFWMLSLLCALFGLATLKLR
ncbi:MAG: phospho-N-acetylmuramoyl-pentapeptide-transferase [Verrucomicrobiales bacterium]|nr:phospho-N-acetylmuramoyl-pentapeptide-transferase [Verrucomicrobiales bacterium]MED5586651.1 phospho-N-acetylmuramoyl-pentapeptide-transferase [Verrucomicrobiota bacterium]